MSFRRRNVAVQPVTVNPNGAAAENSAVEEGGNSIQASMIGQSTPLSPAAMSRTAATGGSAASMARANPLTTTQAARGMVGVRTGGIVGGAASLRGAPPSPNPRFPSSFSPVSRIPGGGATAGTVPASAAPTRLPPGVRTSPVNGCPTISTGLGSLDALFAGHGGLPLGTSVLIEQGCSTGGDQGPAIATADYASVLMKFFVAQGVAHGHRVHIIGIGKDNSNDEMKNGFLGQEAGRMAAELAAEWTDGLPGLEKTEDEMKRKRRMERKSKESRENAITGSDPASERMKIAWRYQRLGMVDLDDDMGDLVDDGTGQTRFRHAFDLRASADGPASRKLLRFYGAESGVSAGSSPSPSPSPSSVLPPSFLPALKQIESEIESSPPAQIHRIVFPPIPLLDTTGLSAILTPSSQLSFLHALRALLRKFPTRTAAVMAHPNGLIGRTSALTRWCEILSDGVIELVVLAANSMLSVTGLDSGGTSRGVVMTPDADDADDDTTGGSKAGKTDTEGREAKPPHGFLRVHKLPLVAERGGTGSGGRKRSLAMTPTAPQAQAQAQVQVPSGDQSQPVQIQPVRRQQPHQADADGGLMVAAGTEFVFTLERRTVRIRPFVLPPVESDSGQQQQQPQPQPQQQQQEGDGHGHEHDLQDGGAKAGVEVRIGDYGDGDEGKKGDSAGGCGCGGHGHGGGGGGEHGGDNERRSGKKDAGGEQRRSKIAVSSMPPKESLEF